MQKKDTIYIDVEDDITAIIGKIKGSKEKIIALVPPKRVGVLQSAVNLRLLARTATNEKKRLVVISGNSALGSLAGSAGIPVAKTLQSKPELIKPDESDEDGEDVIDGGDVSIGEHAGVKDDELDNEPDAKLSKIDDIDIDGNKTSVKKPARGEKDKKPRVKVPDFGMFRKRLTLMISAGVLLVGFFVWAIWFAPHAEVVVTARTSDIDIQTPITVGEKVELDTETKNIPTIVESKTQQDTIEFTPTGEKEVGEKAKGTVKFYNCSQSNPNPVTVPAGTHISSGGLDYITQSTVTVPGPTIGLSSVCGGTPNPGVSADVQIEAEEIGSSYDVSDDTSFSVSINGSLVAVSSSDISGGSKRDITVVSIEDVQRAREELTEDKSDEIKADLMEEFGDKIIVIEESFRVAVGEQKIEPKIGEEATGEATITVEMVYSLSGIAQTMLDDFLEAAIAEQLGGLDGKRIYDTGATSAEFSEFEVSKDKKTATVNLSVTGKVGPKIEDNKIRDIVKGKRYGEIEQELKSIDGVSDVEVNLSPFWVFTVPDDNNKITVKFELENNN